MTPTASRWLLRLLPSLRFRLIFLVLVALLPALGLTLRTYREQRRMAGQEAEARALGVTRLAAANIEGVVEGTREILTALSKLPQGGGDDPSACDVACRYGGEELTLILPDASLEQTRVRAEQLREAARRVNVQHHGRLLAAVTLSMGVAAFPEHGDTADELLGAADKALYRAKGEGRDRVAVA